MSENEDPSFYVYKFGSDLDPRKHEKERAENGFSTYDWWNFNEYLSWIIIQALEKFKQEGSGFPAALVTESNWRKNLDEMIEGFRARRTLDEADNEIFSWSTDEERRRVQEEVETLEAKWRRGIFLFTKYYPSLWD